jgi:hypothetical protein
LPRNSRLLTAGVFLAAAVFSLVSSSVVADFPLGDWRHVKTIVLPSDLQNEALVEIVPDREVFAGSESGLVDLRVVADDETQVPYKLEISKAEHQRTSFRVTLRDKGYVPGRYNTFIADLGREGILHNEVEIRVSSANFRRTATVETSNDGSTWKNVAEQTVYDFTVEERGFTTRNTRVRYSESTARYLCVRIAAEGEGPLEIGGATVFFVKETPAREVSWSASILEVRRGEEGRTTLVEVDLGTPGLPSYRLALQITEVNFHREVTLESSTDREDWRTVQTSGSIYAYDTPKFVGSDLVISYPETTTRYLRLIVRDEDSPPLTIQDLDVWGLRRRLVFWAEPGHSYELYYGNEEAQRPSYDIERVFPYLVTEELPEVRLGPQATNPYFVEKQPPLTERLPWLLPAVITVATILVGFLLMGIIRQARKVLPPPE